MCISCELCMYGRSEPVTCVFHVNSVCTTGLNLAVFRDERGEVHALDAYCPHMGANLAAGGRVKGDCLECPFHAWRFRGSDGKCTHIPYAEKSKWSNHVFWQKYVIICCAAICSVSSVPSTPGVSGARTASAHTSLTLRKVSDPITYFDRNTWLYAAQPYALSRVSLPRLAFQGLGRQVHTHPLRWEK